MITKVHIKGYKKLQDFMFEPQEGMNILVGANDSGKTTVLEAMSLCLNGRINTQSAYEALSPYWFNLENVKKLFSGLPNNETIKLENLPTIRIDVHLNVPDGALQELRGVNNMLEEDSPGISFIVAPDTDYGEEINSYFSQNNIPQIIPVEYYSIQRLSFSGNSLSKTPKGLGITSIDSLSYYSSRGLDYYTKQILEEKLNYGERSSISLEYRKARHGITKSILENINMKIREDAKQNNSSRGVIGIQVNESKTSSWDSAIIPSIDDMPFSMAGQGSQIVAKTRLSLLGSDELVKFIFLEEPENHLSHTRLRELLDIIESLAGNRQVFITTHSPFVLNRLGLDRLVLLSDGRSTKFNKLSKDTILYYKKISGFDTLRLVLADKIIIVEGPSDEILFNRMFMDQTGYAPESFGIDVMSIGGTSFARCFELADKMGRQLYALRDNDGEGSNYWTGKIDNFLEGKKRKMYIGDSEDGVTLEDQVYKSNEALLEGWSPESMKKDKTGTAIKIASMDAGKGNELTPPEYIMKAIHDLAHMYYVENGEDCNLCEDGKNA